MLNFHYIIHTNEQEKTMSYVDCCKYTLCTTYSYSYKYCIYLHNLLIEASPPSEATGWTCSMPTNWDDVVHSIKSIDLDDLDEPRGYMRIMVFGFSSAFTSSQWWGWISASHDQSMSGWETMSQGQWWAALGPHRGPFWLCSSSLHFRNWIDCDKVESYLFVAPLKAITKTI